MSCADNRVPLLLRTAQTLRERFAALRPMGPMPAVMEEGPGDHHPNRDENGRPLLPFSVGDGFDLRWHGGANVDSEGRPNLRRGVWLYGNRDRDGVGRLLQVCRDANGFVPLVRRKYGLPEKCGTTNAIYRWAWTVFELAEAEPPFTVLTLGRVRGVFRCTEPQGFAVPERDIREGCPFRWTYGPPRYWQLDDFAEASIAVMDMIEVAIPSLDGEPEKERPAGNEGPTAEGGDEGSEDTTNRKRKGRPPKLLAGMTIDDWIGVLLSKDPNRRWHYSELAEELKCGESTARTNQRYIDHIEAWETRDAAKAAAKAKQAEDELASLYAEDEDGHGFRVSATKSGIGHQRLPPNELAKQLEHEAEVAKILASETKSRPKDSKKPPR